MAKPTSDVLDVDEQAIVCTVSMLLFGRNRCVEGYIRTLRCHRDNALLRDVLNLPGSGCVLVVDGAGSLDTALLGDRIASSALHQGWAGVIVFGAVRDADTLETLAFHVKALGTTPRKSLKTGPGESDVTLSCGDVAFVPGDYLYSDADGIVVLPRPLTGESL